MKKSIVILLAVMVTITAVISFGCGSSNMRGTFEGTLPCADCPGLQTVLTINPDGQFHMEETYLESNTDKKITEGTWSLDGDILHFTAGDYKFEYKVISANEIRWAPNGQEITGTDLNWSLFKK